MFRANNNGNGVNLNTRLYTSYSDTCMLVLGAWNDKLSLKFHPMKGVNADGIRQYAQDNTEIVNTSLTTDNTIAFLTGIDDKIMPALKESKAETVSVTMGINENRKVVTVGTDGKEVWLSVIINVAENGVADASNELKHTFNKKEYMTGYDPSTGTGTETVNTNSDFLNFVSKLREIYNLSGAAAHAANYANAIKSSYSNKQAMQMNDQPSYSAPTMNYTGDRKSVV